MGLVDTASIIGWIKDRQVCCTPFKRKGLTPANTGLSRDAGVYFTAAVF